MELKYQNELKNFECDFSDFKETDIESYRWTFEDINNPNNFLPVFIKDPSRINNDFRGFALSLYATKEEGIKKFKFLNSNKPMLYKKLGTHIATGKIEKKDGICSTPNNETHFSFFDYKGVDICHKFEIIEQIAS